jgi:hypothetical protein
MSRMQWSPRASRADDNYASEAQSDGRAWARESSQAVGKEQQQEAADIARMQHLGAIREEVNAGGQAAAVKGGEISPADTKKALQWLEQSFAGGAGSSALAMETEQIVAALRSMLGAAASTPDENRGTRTPMRTSISFAEDVEQHQRLQRQQQQQQQPNRQSLGSSGSSFAAAPQSTQMPAARGRCPGVHVPTDTVRMADLMSPAALAYPGQRSAASSPMGFVYRPKTSKAELQQRQQQQQQCRRSTDHFSSSWDNSMFPGGSWGPASPQGLEGRCSSMVKCSKSAKLSSSVVKGSGAWSGLGFRPGSGHGLVLLADDPAFLEACKVSMTECICLGTREQMCARGVEWHAEVCVEAAVATCMPGAVDDMRGTWEQMFMWILSCFELHIHRMQ